MGRRGPAPAPAAVKLLKGETRPSQVNYEAPLPRQTDPVMPRGMEPRARAVWARVIREMRGTGVIVAADTDILRAYCEAVAGYVASRESLVKSGRLVRGARGTDVIVNPLHRLVREERDAMRLLARELGLTPSARAGLRVDMSATSNDIDAVLGPNPRLTLVGAATED